MLETNKLLPKMSNSYSCKKNIYIPANGMRVRGNVWEQVGLNVLSPVGGMLSAPTPHSLARTTPIYHCQQHSSLWFSPPNKQPAI